MEKLMLVKEIVYDEEVSQSLYKQTLINKYR